MPLHLPFEGRQILIFMLRYSNELVFVLGAILSAQKYGKDG